MRFGRYSIYIAEEAKEMRVRFWVVGELRFRGDDALRVIYSSKGHEQSLGTLKRAIEVPLVFCAPW